MHPLLSRLFSLMMACLLLAGTPHSGLAAESPDTSPGQAEVEAMIQTLEDPAAREELVRRLRVLAEAGAEPEEAPVADARTAAAELMNAVSAYLARFGTSVAALAAVVEQAPAGLDWLRDAATTAEKRSYWGMVVLRLAAVLLASYFAGALVRRLLRRTRARVQGYATASLWGRLLWLAVLLLLDLLPVAVFAAAGYASLAAVGAMEETRLVALVWINASIIVQLSLAALRLLAAPDAPSLRLIAMGEETAHYLHIWTRRLVGVAGYGFFALQAGLLLGMGRRYYDSLLDILGLVVVLMLLILVLQNRKEVAAVIRGPMEAGEGGAMATFRRGLAQVWHLLAAAYLILVFGVWALEVEDGTTFILKSTVLSAVVLMGARALLRLASRIFGHWLRLNAELRERFPLLEARVNRYYPILHAIVRGVIHFVAVLALLAAWGVGAFDWLASPPGRVLTGTVISVALILVVSILIWEFVSVAVERYVAEETDAGGAPVTKSARTKTLLTVARNAVLVAVVVVSSLMILSELGINIAPLLAGAGVLGLAIGFGAQRLVQDVITGVFILLQDLMSVGDVVKLGDRAGLVEAITIRTVRLRDLSGTVHTIPFSAIDTVSNLTKDFSFYVFDMGVAYREDVDEVMEVLQEAGALIKEDPEIGPVMLEPVEIFGVDAFGDSSVVIKGRIKTRPIKQWMVGRAFNRAVKKLFDERGIEIPFPHRTLYFGVDKDGNAPPVPLSSGLQARTAPVDVLQGDAGESLRRQDEAGPPPGP